MGNRPSPKHTILLALAFAVAHGVDARICLGQEAEDDARYNLFNPVPDDRMREMSTDRPDTTESPYSVPAGHVQIEMDVAMLATDRRGPTRTTHVDIVPINFKLGLADFMDLQVLLETFHTTTAMRGNVPEMSEQGYGATTIRLKLNLYGNDAGATALALMPFVTHDHGVTEAGLIVPFAASLPAGFGLGLMLEGDLVVRDSGRYAFELLSTATLGHDVYGPLAAYVEVAGIVAAYDTAASTFSVHGGLTYAVNDGLQLDMGTRVGVLGPVNDAEFFFGLSARR